MQRDFQHSTAPRVKDFGPRGSVSFVEEGSSSGALPTQDYSSFDALVRTGNKAPASRAYHPPYYIAATEIKLESQLDLVVGVDLVSSVQTAFQDSQALAAHNLWNLWMGEELRDVLPHLIVNAAFTQMCLLKGGTKSPLFYMQVLISIQNQTKESSLFKNFARLIEDGFHNLAKWSDTADPLISERIVNLAAYYISQVADDFRVESRDVRLYERLEEANPQILHKVFQELVRMSFLKKIREATEPRYHKYLGELAGSDDSQLTLVHAETPDFALIKDKLASRETPAQLKYFLLDGGDEGQLQASGDILKEVFLECILERTRKSLEHLKRAVEAFHTELFSHMYYGKSILVVGVVLRAYRERNPVRGL
jgi:hypothetical protein